ncbi:hypothetical protein B296_00013491 [Ensete ventricosum]|uniref:Uncharacterized protein n=1 Tax=Ensete ventricosum TaxID=4639 RepID=A0A426YG94_ENSVE|nr:hypothetical protein B296_00013491 [Ensete ventricosum]
MAKKVNSGTNPRDLAEKVNSSTNPEDLAKKVNSGTNPEDLTKKVNSGMNPKDFVEKVNSGTNPEDVTPFFHSDALDICISVEALEVDLRFPLHPLIEECLSRDADQMDLSDLRGMPKMSNGKAPSIHAIAPALEVGVSPAMEAPKTSSKRPIDAPTGQADDPARRHKKVKLLTRRHKSRHDGGDLAPTLRTRS